MNNLTHVRSQTIQLILYNIGTFNEILLRFMTKCNAKIIIECDVTLN